MMSCKETKKAVAYLCRFCNSLNFSEMCIGGVLTVELDAYEAS